MITMKHVIEDPSKEHEEKWGGYNSRPPNMREITEQEFAKSRFFTYTPEFTEFRQFSNDPVKAENGSSLINAKLFFMHDETGYIMMHDYWGSRVRYFMFGCKHEMVEIRPKHNFRCYHTYKCKICGYEESFDSSD